MEEPRGTYANHSLTRPCPLCRSTEGHLIEDLHFVVFDDSAISGNCALVSCALCGFAFYDTSSTQADFDQYYQQNAYYYTATTAGTGGLSSNDLKRFEDLCDRFSSHIPNNQAVIFDVGCAKGGLLSILKQRGFQNLHGLDMQQDCVKHVRDTLGIPAETGSALDLPFHEVKTDILIYSHVVEHVIDLSLLLESAHKKLSEDGLLYVEVPDASRYGEFTTYPYQDLYLEHVNHFSPSTLNALFNAAGFGTIATGQFELETPPAGKVPCTWAVFRKARTMQSKPNWSLEQNLTDYMSWSKQHKIHKILEELAQTKMPLYLWGISQYAMLMLGHTSLSQCNIRGFIDIDSSKRMRTLLGLSIDLPEILRNNDPNCGLIVTAPGYEATITNTLDKIKFRGKLILT